MENFTSYEMCEQMFFRPRLDVKARNDPRYQEILAAETKTPFIVSRALRATRAQSLTISKANLMPRVIPSGAYGRPSASVHA